MKPRAVVVVAFVASLAIIVLADAGKGEFPSPRRFVGATVGFIFLGFMAEFAPQLAVPLAILVVVALLFARGEEALFGLAAEPKLELVKGGKKA